MAFLSTFKPPSSGFLARRTRHAVLSQPLRRIHRRRPSNWTDIDFSMKPKSLTSLNVDGADVPLASAVSWDDVPKDVSESARDALRAGGICPRVALKLWEVLGFRQHSDLKFLDDDLLSLLSDVPPLEIKRLKKLHSMHQELASIASAAAPTAAPASWNDLPDEVGEFARDALKEGGITPGTALRLWEVLGFTHYDDIKLLDDPMLTLLSDVKPLQIIRLKKLISEYEEQVEQSSTSPTQTASAAMVPDLNVVNNLLKILESNSDGKVQQEATGALVRIALLTCNEAIGSCELHTLTKPLSSPDANALHLQLATALECIGKIASAEDFETSIFQSDKARGDMASTAIRLLVPLLESQEAAVREKASWALSYQTSVTGIGIGYDCDEDTYNALVLALSPLMSQLGPDSPFAVQKSAAEVLKHIAEFQHHNMYCEHFLMAEEIVEAGGVAPLVHLLASVVPEVQQQAAAALYYLKCKVPITKYTRNDIVDAIEDAGALPFLISLVSSGFDHTDTASLDDEYDEVNGWASLLLCEIAEYYAKQPETFGRTFTADAATATSLMKLMSGPRINPAVKEAALKLLELLRFDRSTSSSDAKFKPSTAGYSAK